MPLGHAKEDGRSLLVVILMSSGKGEVFRGGSLQEYTVLGGPPGVFSRRVGKVCSCGEKVVF